MPAITSWVLAIGGAVIGSVIYGALKGELNDSPLLNAIHNIVGSQKAEVTS